ncbi:MAG: lactate utilization protein [Eubacteriales bacterium]|nr:lactate utilization protein [Eubacteriales bacterium]
MSYITESYAHTAEVLTKKFQKRGMEAVYCPTAAEAREQILSMIPEGSSVTWGGSESMAQAGVFCAVQDGPYHFIDRKSASTPEEARALYGQIVCADYFLTSTNAFTKEGELVNIDGNANRVACISHGPAHVIVLASMDKLCGNIQEAMTRIRTHACPPNAIRVKADTPCAKTGLCADCVSPDCICCQILVTRYSRTPGRIQIVLCGEKLGF